MARAERDRRKALAGVVDIATELGTIFGTRMKESDERDAAMIDLTAKLEKMTRTLVRFGVASLVVSIVSLVVAVVALTA
ncbi:hypothetical protein [Baekduia sp. Peel2402]|uniref:hypothetical protein n=1 Tax=Baekduia sp. Peel2402 TaxID=3458296 RepID=UPI00403E4F2B